MTARSAASGVFRLLWIGNLALAALAEEPQGAFDHFENRIRPILEDRCLDCHGEDKQKGGLRLDSRAGWMRGGESGAVIAPGKPDDSLLISAVRYWDKNLQMPPKHALEAREVNDLIEWVKQGAPDPRSKVPETTEAKQRTSSIDLEQGRKHWAFQPIKAMPPPTVKDEAWPRNEVDRFILHRMETAGVKPAADADRLTLLRRVTYDLTGLPPTPEEITSFNSDTSPDAFAKVVDRLLDSTRYGERWGRHWLDVARYADTCGNASDYPIPQAYKYRNYVLQAFNEDKPFNEFIREQIAGDLLESKSEEERQRRIIATGYLAAARHFAGGSGEPHLTIEDAIENVGRAFLGLSLSCARCHDHKFDPISTQEYYGLYGIFSSSVFPHPGSEGKNRPANLVPLVPKDELERLTKLRGQQLAEIDAEKKRADEAKTAIEKEPESPERKSKLENAQKTASEIQERKKRLSAELPYPAAYSVSEGQPKNARVQVRGDPKRLGDEVPRGFLQVLGGQRVPENVKASGRLELADWIAQPANPLTARVFVNRLWHYHFGRGLVSTPNDFGLRGQPPSHPELLDYLANRFVSEGWSSKAMHRVLLLSRTWQLASSSDGSRDASNLLWSRAERRRLDAEEIRDTMLYVSGELDLSIGAEHPFPPVHSWGFTQHNQFFAVYDNRQRTVYQMQQRLRKNPFLLLFDGPDPNSSTAVRPQSTTPLQSLFAMNDSFAHERATRFAKRVADSSDEEGRRLQLAYLSLFGRSPEPEESEAAMTYIEKIRTDKKLSRGDAWNSLCRALMASNEFLFLD